MAIDPHVFMKTKHGVCRVCGLNERMCGLTYKPRQP